MRRIRLLVTLVIVVAAGAPEVSAVLCMMMPSSMAMDGMAMDGGGAPETVVTEQHTVSRCPLSRCVSPVVARLADSPTTAVAPAPHRQLVRLDANRPIRSADAPPLPPPKSALSLI